MRNNLLETLLISLTTITMVVVIIVPHANIYFPIDNLNEDERWKPIHIWDDLILGVLYFSILFTWIIYLAVKNRRAEIVVKIILLLVAVLSFVVVAEGAVFSSQDFEPGYGVMISALIFPMVAAYLIYRRRVTRSKRGSD